MDTIIKGLLWGTAIYIGYVLIVTWYYCIIRNYISVVEAMGDQIVSTSNIFIEALENRIDRLDENNPNDMRELSQCIEIIKDYKELKEQISDLKEITAVDKKKYS